MNDKPVTQEMLNSAERSQSLNEYHRSLQSENYERAWFVLNENDHYLSRGSDIGKGVAWVFNRWNGRQFKTWREAKHQAELIQDLGFWKKVTVKWLPTGRELTNGQAR